LFSDSNDEPRHMSLAFQGNKIGTLDWSSSSWNLISIDEDGIPGPPIYMTHNGQTTITKYGSIGERVEGTLSGIIVEMTTRDTLTANGEFSVIRIKDFMPN
jgi:hypothetical protein